MRQIQGRMENNAFLPASALAPCQPPNSPTLHPSKQQRPTSREASAVAPPHPVSCFCLAMPLLMGHQSGGLWQMILSHSMLSFALARPEVKCRWQKWGGLAVSPLQRCGHQQASSAWWNPLSHTTSKCSSHGSHFTVSSERLCGPGLV